jgi:small nuclear ribonucleoprotein (snRNP)-like protein
MMKDALEKNLNRKVILDTRSSWVYIGTLEKVTPACIVLTDADAHDSTDSATTKELYIFESRTTGIKSNRTTVYVRLDCVISFSLLEDVKLF